MLENKATSRTALLVMDMQKPMLSMLQDKTPEMIQQVNTAIGKARAAGMPVIHVMVVFREGFPEVSPNNKGFSAIRQTRPILADAEAAAIHPDISRQPGDVVVTKRRISAFAGSDLEVVLRANGIDTMVLCGIATSGVVLSTLREAADKDYKLTVLSDCCADADEEVHRVLLTKVFPRQAEVMTTAEWNV